MELISDHPYSITSIIVSQASSVIIIMLNSSENERRVDEDMRDIKQVKDELREKRSRVNELEVFVYRCCHM